MDYKEKYNAALERARQFIEHPLQEDSENIAEYIFPELKESEDEKIRKSIIAILDNYIDDDNTIKPAIMNWLEKQERALNPDEVIEWLESKVYDDSAYGMAMIEQFKKDFQL